jgi:hypothetical protein
MKDRVTRTVEDLDEDTIHATANARMTSEHDHLIPLGE